MRLKTELLTLGCVLYIFCDLGPRQYYCTYVPVRLWCDTNGVPVVVHLQGLGSQVVVCEHQGGELPFLQSYGQLFIQYTLPLAVLEWLEDLIKPRFADYSPRKTRGFFTYALAPFLTNINFVQRTYTLFTLIRTNWQSTFSDSLASPDLGMLSGLWRCPSLHSWPQLRGPILSCSMHNILILGFSNDEGENKNGGANRNGAQQLREPIGMEFRECRLH